MPSEKPDLPSQEELAQLPPRAIVAYAVRCARRVQVLCIRTWPKNDERRDQLLDVVERALDIASKFAGGAKISHISIPEVAAAADAGVGNAATRSHAEAASHAVSAAAAANAGAHAAAHPAVTSLDHAANTIPAHVVHAAHAAHYSNVAAIAAGDGAHVAVRREARRDFDLLRERFEKKPAAVRRSVSPSERGFLGKYWQGEPPEWYRVLKSQLNQAHRKSAKGDGYSRVWEQQSLSAKADADESGRGMLSFSRDELDSLAQRLTKAKGTSTEDLLRLKQQVEASVERREAIEAEVEEINQALLDVQKERDEALHGRRESERELAESRSALDLQTTQPFRWYLDNVRTPESIFSFIALGLLGIVVLMVLFGIGELRARQKLEMFLTSQVSKLREQLADGGADRPGEGDDDVNTLAEFHKHHGRLQTLTVSGTDRNSQTLPEIRNDVFLLLQNGPSESPPMKDASTPETAVSWVWPWRMPRYMTSDLLLALVVTMSGMVGAIVIVFRTGDRIVRPTDLAFGVAAGFITLLAIRGGKNVFLLQSEEVSFYLNPYSSAFFGLLAGLFTNDAFQVLRKFVKKFVVSLERTFELPEGDNGEPAKSLEPSKPDKASGRQESSEEPSRPPPDGEDAKEDSLDR